MTLDVLEVVSALVVEIELSTVRFVRPIMISISASTFEVGLIDLVSLTKTSKSFLILFPINKAQAQHIISDNKVLIKAINLTDGQLGQLRQGTHIGLNRIISLLNIGIEFSQQTIYDKFIIVFGGEKGF